MSGTEHNKLNRGLRVAIFGRNPRLTLVRAAVLVVVSIIVFRYVLLPVKVDGISMDPTYHDGSVHFIYRLAYLHDAPQRGDVVGIRAGDTNRLGRVPSILYMKRIIGLPGETISFTNGTTFINGRPLSEPYLKYEWRWYHPPVLIGTNQYYFIGDNRSMPFDYHFKGRANREQVVGKVLF